MYTDAYACSNLPQMPDRASTVALWTEPYLYSNIQLFH